MSDEPALEVKGMVKRYGDRTALRGVDLVAQAGQVHGLLGPNGAGKTTLMRVLLGLVRRDAGTVRLLGRHVRTTAGPIPAGVAGFVEAPRFYPYLSGRQNLRLLARIDGPPSRSREKERIDEALERAGLSAHADVRVGSYSAGMTQRLGLAATLMRKPFLLLLDEPTSSLDPACARDVRAEVRRLAEDGVAVLLCSHDMAEVEDLCASLTILHEGRVVFAGTLEELRKGAPASVHVLGTSNDEAALALASGRTKLDVARAPDGTGLEVSAGQAQLDAYVLALGAAGVAVRRLELRTRSLEGLFLRLTAESGEGSKPPPEGTP